VRAFNSLSLFLSLSLSLTGEQGAHALFTNQRERERKRERGRERQRERKRERECEREADYVFQLSRIIFIFKRNDGCLRTF
jgi:hypothetical protein